jgi:predicted aspartyl protease
MSRDTVLWAVMGVIGAGVILLMMNNDAGVTFGIENYQFASLVFLGSIGLVFAVSLFGRGAAIGPLVRMAAIWLCLILGLMVGYQVLARLDMLPENFRPQSAPVKTRSADADETSSRKVDWALSRGLS